MKVSSVVGSLRVYLREGSVSAVCRDEGERWRRSGEYMVDDRSTKGRVKSILGRALRGSMSSSRYTG